MKIEMVSLTDASELLEIYAPYVKETAISFEYDVPSVEEFKDRIENISAKYPYIKALDDKNKIIGYAYAGSFKVRKAYDWSVETTVYVENQPAVKFGKVCAINCYGGDICPVSYYN